MLRTVVAIERDGLDVRVLSLQFDVPNAEFDLKDAIRKASTDYCKTPDGKIIYEYNCSYFNWADFAMNVPQEFCERYGFKIIDTVVSDIEVDWDEQLVDDSQIEEEGETYTAFVYEEDGVTTEDLATYDNKDEAIRFAKSHNWDEVVNDVSGEVVWLWRNDGSL